MTATKPLCRIVALAWCAACTAGVAAPASAAACLFEPLGEGRVAEIVDGRSFRMVDGREIRLAGIEADGSDKAALTAIVAGQDVTLRGNDDTPDRYGRQV